jgi:hypothetical protein
MAFKIAWTIKERRAGDRLGAGAYVILTALFLITAAGLVMFESADDESSSPATLISYALPRALAGSC